MTLPITLTIAGAAAILLVWLGIRITRLRMTRNISVGDGGDPLLTARVRAHGNFAEYTPFVLVLMALIELAGRHPTALWAIGAVYLLARLAHVFGMERPAPNALRAGGAVVTWLALVVLAGWALGIGYGLGI